MKTTTFKITQDYTDKLDAVIKSLQGAQVLVGIPEAATDRKKDEDGPITNAALLALNEFGSEALHIPPRPVMEIGLKKAKDQIAEQFKKAAQVPLKAGATPIFRFFERAGIIAANSIKKVINSQQDIVPPSAATLAIRQAAGFKGTKALVVTGQMRNAITSVVTGKL